MAFQLKKLGPGLLWAGAAIGVSHVVQSTKAGGMFGWTLWWAIVLANLAKAPFFEFGPRYAAATGESLIEGFKKLGTWAVALFIILTLMTMFTIQAAVTVVTAGLAIEITGITMSAAQWSALLLGICLVILGFGHYRFLDRLIKGVIIVLTLTTIAAFVMSLMGPSLQAPPDAARFDFSSVAHVMFLIALMGWMPAPVDIAVWHSLWTLAKQRTLDKDSQMSLKDSLFDFHVGYWGTAILALAFFGLGALTIYTSGEKLEASGGAFAKQVISIYTKQLGEGTYWIIALAAFTTMFSTTLTCLDAFPRVLRRTTQALLPQVPQAEGHHGLYWGWILFTTAGTLIVLFFFLKNMAQLVNLATTLSFLTTPVLAWMCYLVVTSKHMPEAARPSKLLRLWALTGLALLIAFALYYVKMVFFS